MAKIVLGHNGVAYRLHEGFTHAGVFHADDIFSTALLRILNPEIEISRGFKVPEDFDGIAYDIGGGEFDHHFDGSPIRDDGTPYSSFGLLWERFGRSFFQTEESFSKIDELLVQSIDITDCTGEKNPLSTLISSYNLNWDSTESDTEAFNKAVSVAQQMLNEFIESCRASERAHETLSEYEANSSDGIIVLEKFVPWGELISKEEPKLLVFPSQREGWNIRTLPVSHTDNSPRITLPKEWWGNKNIAEDTDGRMTFCHLSGFMGTAKDKETALEICKELVEKASK